MNSDTQRLILGSQSPRRRELLDQMGLAGKYEVMPSEFDEQLDEARSPAEVAEELGYGKALWVAERNPGAWVIGSDTIVSIDGKQLAKPADVDEAREMLKLLVGRASTVTTSAVLVRATTGKEGEQIINHYIGYEETSVYFKPYDEAAIETYLASGDWRDKAGAYGIQSGAHTLIDHIEGNYDTVVGLPTHTLRDFLADVGIEARAVELTPAVPQH